MKKYILILLFSVTFIIGYSQTYYSNSQNIGTIQDNIVIDNTKSKFSYKITIDSLTITIEDLSKCEIIFKATFEKTQINEFGVYYTVNSKETAFLFHSKNEKYMTMYIPDGEETHYIRMDYQ